MIIDVHGHFWDDRILTEYGHMMLDECGDASYTELLRQMDEAGIDKATLMIMSDPRKKPWFKDYHKYNDMGAEAIQHHPERFIGFAGIDPRSKDALQELERCVDLGYRGVKMWTLTGFYPDNKEYYPFYSRVQELGLPMLFHTGYAPPDGYKKCNQPINVDSVAVDFPELTMILAHVGYPWVDEAIAVAGFNFNVYFDVSGFQKFDVVDPNWLVKVIHRTKKFCGLGKMLFGLDFPSFTDWHRSLKVSVDYVKNLETPGYLLDQGYTEVTEEDKRMILGDNAVKALGL
jgi:predicted TIM-barrel fold metal-dependent hydrolase